jgi:hypothetical protein
MYKWWVKNSLTKSLITSITTFHSWFISYALFSNLDWYKNLHALTLKYVDFFLKKINYFNLWYALSLVFILLVYFLLVFSLYSIFDTSFNKTKSQNLRNLIENVFNVIIWIGFSWFWIAIFSPYLTFTRDLYNYYELMLGIEIMLISLIMLTVLIVIQYGLNTYIPSLWLFNFLKKNKKSKVREEEYVENEYPEDYWPWNLNRAF